MLEFMPPVYHDEFRAPGEALRCPRSDARRSVPRTRRLRPGSEWERRRSGPTGILKRARYEESSLHLGQRVQKSRPLKINFGSSRFRVGKNPITWDELAVGARTRDRRCGPRQFNSP